MKKMKSSQNKTKFFVNIWVTGTYNNQSIIGRTCVINGINSIVLITEDAFTKVIQYDELSNISKLTFNKQKSNNKLSTKNQLLPISELLFQTLNKFEIQN